MKPKPTLHPILENRSFPPQEAPLSVIVGFPSKKRQSVINTLTRKSMKAVFNHPYGKGVNPHWSKKVPVKDLKLATSLTLVGNTSSFSLSQFIPWDGMMGVGDNFCGGPKSDRFLRPDVYWPSFQVYIQIFSITCFCTICTTVNIHLFNIAIIHTQLLIIEHHSILCGINVEIARPGKLVGGRLAEDLPYF